ARTGRRARSRCRMSSRTAESTPPLKATTRRSPGLTTPASCSVTRETRSAAARLLLRFLELAMTDELREPRFQQLVDRLVLELPPGLLQRSLEVLHHCFVIAVSAPRRLGDNAVYQPERLQPRRGDAERFGGVPRTIRALPEDGGAPLRRDHRVGRVLQHQGHITDREREGAARAPLADDRADYGHPQLGHGVEVAPDRLRLAALLGADARIGARRIHEREHRRAELLGELHQSQRLAEALRLGHSEIAMELFLRIAALLVPDHDAALAAEARHSANDRRVVGKRPVAVELLEPGEQAVDVVERVGALGMARDLRDLPCVELAVNLLGERLAFLLEPRDLFGDVQRRIVLDETQLVDLRLELGDRLLEIQEGRLHAAQ